MILDKLSHVTILIIIDGYRPGINLDGLSDLCQLNQGSSF